MAGTIRILALVAALSLAVTSSAQNSPGAKGKFWGLDGLDEAISFEGIWAVIEDSAHIERRKVGSEETKNARSAESRLARLQKSATMARVVRVTSGSRTQLRPDPRLERLCRGVGRQFCAHLIIEDTQTTSQRQVQVPREQIFDLFSVSESPQGREFQALRQDGGSIDGWLIYDCWGLLVWSAPNEQYGAPLAKAILSTLASSCSNRRQAARTKPPRKARKSADVISVARSAPKAPSALSAPKAPKAPVTKSQRSTLDQLTGPVLSVNQPRQRIPFRQSWAGDPGQSRHRPRLLVFWATWCAPCLKELPELLELKARYGKDVLFIGVSKDSYRDQRAIDASWAAIRKLVDLKAWSTQYLSLGQHLEKVLFPEQVSGHGEVPLPAFALLDHRGGLQFKMIGALSAQGHRTALVSNLEQAIRRSKSSGGANKNSNVAKEHR